MEIQRLTIRIFDPRLHQQLKGVAKLRGTTMDAIVNEAIAERIQKILQEEYEASKRLDTSKDENSSDSRLVLAA